MIAKKRAKRVVAAGLAAVLGMAMLIMGLNIAPASAHEHYPKVVLQCWKIDHPDFSTAEFDVSYPQSAVDCDSLPVTDGFAFDQSIVVDDSCDGAAWQFDWYSIGTDEEQRRLDDLIANGLTLDEETGLPKDTVAGLLDPGHNPRYGTVVSKPNPDLCTPPTPEPQTKFEDFCDLSTVEGLPPGVEGQSGRVNYESTDGGETWTITGFDLRNVSGCDNEHSLKVVEEHQEWSACDVSTIAGLPADFAAEHKGQSGTVTKTWKQAYYVEGETETPNGGPYEISYSYADTTQNCAPAIVDVPGDIDAECVGDVPWLQYSVKAGSDIPAGSLLRITFLHPSDPSQNYTIDGLSAVSGKFLWPGASVDDGGVASGWPGWKQDANGDWVSVGDANYGWTRKGVQVRFETYVPAQRAVVANAAYVVSAASARTVVPAASTVAARTFTATVTYPEASALCAGPAERVLPATVTEPSSEATTSPERVLPAAVNSGEDIKTVSGSKSVGLLLIGGGAGLIVVALFTMAGVRYRGQHTF